MYTLTNLLFSVSLVVYVTVNVMMAAVRWGHKCASYAAHMDYYFPAWRTLIYCALSNLVLLPAVFMPNDTDALIQLRLMLILSSPYLCAVMMFSYFGRVLKVTWWKKPIYILSFPYALLSGFLVVLVIIPGTQLQLGELLFAVVFYCTCMLAAAYLVCFVLAFRMIALELQRFSEENYSNPDDFPKQYAQEILWIPVLHLIMSWSMAINGAMWAFSFGFLILSALGVVFLLGALSPHRAIEVEQLEAGEVPVEPEPEPVPAKTEPVPEGVELLSAERKEEILALIRHEVENENAYLDNHLTLASLSRRCGMNRTYVSIVLSERLGGFFNYINQCRLAHVDSYRAANPKSDLGEAVLASGFSNRQSYYNARKRLK